MARRRRGLSDEDRALWNHVAKSVTPRQPDRPSPPEPPTAPAKPPAATPKATLPKAPASDLPPPVPRPQPFRVGERAQSAAPVHRVAPDISSQMAQAPVQMDRKAHTRLKRGKLVPEARIDLHGMTQAQAHPALTRFVIDAHNRGLRLVLVITGKGKDRDEPGPMPVPRGVLKHQVPHWLRAGVLRALVLDIAEAHQKHGGSGAYYVYLRRHR